MLNKYTFKGFDGEVENWLPPVHSKTYGDARSQVFNKYPNVVRLTLSQVEVPNGSWYVLPFNPSAFDLE